MLSGTRTQRRVGWTALACQPSVLAPGLSFPWTRVVLATRAHARVPAALIRANQMRLGLDALLGAENSNIGRRKIRRAALAILTATLPAPGMFVASAAR